MPHLHDQILMCGRMTEVTRTAVIAVHDNRQDGFHLVLECQRNLFIALPT